jgi:hypothetical protein
MDCPRSVFRKLPIDRACRWDFIEGMRVCWLAIVCLGLAISGCAGKKAAAPEENFSVLPAITNTAPVPGLEQQLSITSETALIGKVAMVNNNGRFVVLTFPIGHLPGAEQRMSLYRQGQKVGEIKISNMQQEDNVVADLTSGDAQVGDEVRER